MSVDFQILTVAEAAEILKATEDQVRAELEAGTLRGFRIGGEWRTTDEAIRQKVWGQAARIVPPFAPDVTQPTTSGLFAPDWRARRRLAALRSAQHGHPYQDAHAGPEGLPPGPWFAGHAVAPEALDLKWEDVGEFEWKAPQKRDEYVKGRHPRYRRGFHATAILGVRKIALTIGYADKRAFGRERVRVSVFRGRPGGALFALAEFVGVDEYDTTHQVANVIRDFMNRNVRPGQPLPPGYENMPVGAFDDFVTGPYSTHSMAVIVDAEDRDTMARHALLRTRGVR